jgi:ZIP family zinc transporter
MKYCDSPKEPLQYEKVITEEMTDDELGFSALRRARMQHGVLNSLLAGLSTSVGAVIICQSPAKAISSEHMSFVLSFAAGAMASATLLEFWLPLVTSDNLAQDTSHVILFSGIGGIAFWLLSLMIDTTLGRKQVDIEEDCSARRSDQRGSSLSARFAALRSATILMVTLTLHNIPEGFAVLMSSLGEQKKSSTVMFAIAMHNIPEGVAIATPILAATGSQKKALGMTLVSGLAEPVGALLAWVLMHVTGVVTEDCIDHILCVVGGIMIAVVVMELMPDAMRLATARVWILGFATGCTVVSASIALGA